MQWKCVNTKPQRNICLLLHTGQVQLSTRRYQQQWWPCNNVFNWGCFFFRFQVWFIGWVSALPLYTLEVFPQRQSFWQCSGVSGHCLKQVPGVSLPSKITHSRINTWQKTLAPLHASEKKNTISVTLSQLTVSNQVSACFGGNHWRTDTW